MKYNHPLLLNFGDFPTSQPLLAVTVVWKVSRISSPASATLAESQFM